MESMSLRDVLIAGGIIGIFLAGWSAFIQSKLGSLSKLWIKFDTHVKEYAKDRLADAKEYASKKDVAEVESRIEQDLQDIKTSQKEMDRKLDKLLGLK